jgi:hypothetical protein
MDSAQIAELRSWASRLESREEDDELRAAGKAILLLVDELERLQTQAASPAGSAVGAPLEDTVSEPEEEGLRNRLRRTFGYS